MCLDDCSGGRPPTRRDVMVWGSAAVLAACHGGRTATTPAPPASGIGEIAVDAVTFRNGSFDVSGMVFRSAGDVRRPVVLVGHGDPGIPPYLQELCKRIAALDLAVLAVEWTKRFPPFPSAEAEIPRWRRDVGASRIWYGAADDFGAGRRWMVDQKLGHPDLAAAVGVCGSGVVLAHHAARGGALAGLVLFYANPRLQRDFHNPDDPLPDLLDIADRIKVPVQAHCGVHDQTARLDDARELERRLAAAGAAPEFHYYDDAGHGFLGADAPLNAEGTFGYVESAARTAEDRMRKWLTERLPRA